MNEKLIVALDVSTRDQAFELVKQLDGEVGAFKIGMQLYNSEGPDIVRDIQRIGGKVFVDLKFHDIPNTVGQTSRVMVRREAFMFTLHASGGFKMLKAAADSCADEAALLKVDKPLLLAVTVLTSISQDAFNNEIGLSGTIEQQVTKWAALAKQAGIDGVVCSPWEISAIRHACGENLLIVTPGVRPAWAAKGDQERIMTPKEAIARGASYLVVGRPITAHTNPVEAVKMIVAEMEEGAKAL